MNFGLLRVGRRVSSCFHQNEGVSVISLNLTIVNFRRPLAKQDLSTILSESNEIAIGHFLTEVLASESEALRH